MGEVSIKYHQKADMSDDMIGVRGRPLLAASNDGGGSYRVK